MSGGNVPILNGGTSRVACHETSHVLLSTDYYAETACQFGAVRDRVGHVRPIRDGNDGEYDPALLPP